MKCLNCGTTESRKWRKNFCDSCYLKQWRKDNADSVNQYTKDFEVRFRHSSRNAKRRSLDWLLTLDEFIDVCSKPCHYCANKLGKMTTTNAGLDRIDNSLGYIFSNILPCCRVCNTIRNEFLTVEETKEVINLIIKLRNL